MNARFKRVRRPYAQKDLGGRYLRVMMIALLWSVAIVPEMYAQMFTVPGATGHNWFDTRITVQPGTLIRLTATGRVNVGSGVGEVGPEGLSGTGTLRFPETTRPFGLLARLTSSPWAHDELRETWAYGNTVEYCAQAEGHLWLTVNDSNAADNTGAFLVTVTLSSCTVPDPRPRSTIVHLTDDNGRNVEGADLFVRGRRMGVTNRNGISIFPELPAGTEIVARKLVWENPTPRPNHAQGSTRDWNYRVYNTTVTVQNDGTLDIWRVSSPLDTQRLRLSTSNTLIGLHWVVSVEWDASNAELQAIRDNNILPASQMLYNATDGQFFIEQVEMADNARFWSDADMLIYANWSLRAYVNYAGGFFGNCFACGNSYMNMSRMNWSYVYAHEFAHYGLDLLDEYDDNSPIACTPNVISTTSPFGWNDSNRQSSASCLMWNTAPKLCSMHPDNPHINGTRQGSQDCWSHVIQRYRDQERGFLVRWALKSPTTRNAIVGQLPTVPVSDWMTRVAIDNRAPAPLCMPVDLRVVRADNGMPLADVDVYLRTTYGQDILAGKSRRDDPNTPEDETGDIQVTGVHVGDQVRANGAPFTITGCALTSSIDRPSRGLLYAHADPSMPARAGSLEDGLPMIVPVHAPADSPDAGGTVVAGENPFALSISFEPGGREGEAQVRVGATVPLASPPQVELIRTGEVKGEQVRMEYEPATKAYSGAVRGLPGTMTGILRVSATDAGGRRATEMQSVAITPLDTRREMDVFSSDGQLSFTIPAKGLSPGTRLTVGPSDVPAPSLESGLIVAAGPYKVSGGKRSTLADEGVVRFQLPDQPIQKGGTVFNGARGLDPTSFTILRYNPARKEWVKLDSRFIPEVAIVSAPTRELGTYLLAARPMKGNEGAAVVEATLSAKPSKYEGKCPAVITFTGTIAMKQPGTVTYTFIRSDGAIGPVMTLDFKKPGTETVSTTWTLGGNALPSYQGWQAIRILSPTPLESNRASFSIKCY